MDPMEREEPEHKPIHYKSLDEYAGEYDHEAGKVMDQYPGVFSRIFAFLLDLLILGLFGLFLMIPFQGVLAFIGQWGRIVGYVIAVAYFSVMTAQKGQTLGKRIMKIKAVDGECNTLPLYHAMARYAVSLLPFFTYNLHILSLSPAMPVKGALAINGIAPFISYALGGFLIYLYIFNTKTRQSLHDLMVGSYVVKEEVLDTIEPYEPPRKHFVIGGVFSLAVFVIFIVLVPMFKYRATKVTPLRTSGQFKKIKHVISSRAVHHEVKLVGVGALAKLRFNLNLKWGGSAKKMPAITPEAMQIAMSAFKEARQAEAINVEVEKNLDLGVAVYKREFRTTFRPPLRLPEGSVMVTTVRIGPLPLKWKKKIGY